MKLLIIAKTYPVPQKDPAKAETVCTGAIGEDGRFYRLYPVPFRFSEWMEKYGKWEYISADLKENLKDTRKESRIPSNLVRKGIKLKNKREQIRRLLPGLKDSFSQMNELRKKGWTITLCHLRDINLSWTENEARKRHENIINNYKNMLIKDDWSEAIKDLHLPRNLIYVSWKDAEGKTHRHKLFEWEYYKVLSDRIRDGLSEEDAESSVIKEARETRFKNEEHEVWGLFGTMRRRPQSWVLAAIYNYRVAEIEQTRETLFPNAITDPYSVSTQDSS